MYLCEWKYLEGCNRHSLRIGNELWSLLSASAIAPLTVLLEVSLRFLSL